VSSAENFDHKTASSNQNSETKILLPSLLRTNLLIYEYFRGIIFVVDSVNFTRELHAVAE
jgi:hypothetical protein